MYILKKTTYNCPNGTYKNLVQMFGKQKLMKDAKLKKLYPKLNIDEMSCEDVLLNYSKDIVIGYSLSPFHQLLRSFDPKLQEIYHYKTSIDKSANKSLEQLQNGYQNNINYLYRLLDNQKGRLTPRQIQIYNQNQGVIFEQLLMLGSSMSDISSGILGKYSEITQFAEHLKQAYDYVFYLGAMQEMHEYMFDGNRLMLLNIGKKISVEEVCRVSRMQGNNQDFEVISISSSHQQILFQQFQRTAKIPLRMNKVSFDIMGMEYISKIREKYGATLNNKTIEIRSRNGEIEIVVNVPKLLGSDIFQNNPLPDIEFVKTELDKFLELYKGGAEGFL